MHNKKERAKERVREGRICKYISIENKKPRTHEDLMRVRKLKIWKNRIREKMR